MATPSVVGGCDSSFPDSERPTMIKKTAMKNHRSTFAYPILLVILLDAIFTVIGQPPEYWHKFTNVNEGSPLGFHFLQSNPWLFLVFMAIYMGGVTFLLKKLPLFWSSVLGLTLFIGHTYGSSSWIYIMYSRLGLPDFPFANWYLKIGYFVIISLVTSFILRKETRRFCPPPLDNSD